MAREVEPGEIVIEGGNATIGAPVMRVMGASQTQPGQPPLIIEAELEDNEPADPAGK